MKLTMQVSELEQFIKRFGLTHAQTAYLLGVTESAVHHWLNGIRKMQPTVIKCIRFLNKHPEMVQEFWSAV